MSSEASKGLTSSVSMSKGLSSHSKLLKLNVPTSSNPKFSIYEEDTGKNKNPRVTYSKNDPGATYSKNDPGAYFPPSDIFSDTSFGTATGQSESKTYTAAIADAVSNNMSKQKGHGG